jgi:uncharacterized protein with PQ loop repeat
MENKPMTEQESLKLITDMINKTKASFHETGFGPIMWGIVITLCGLLSYFKEVYGFTLGFDHWLLVLIALIPQIWYSINQSKKIKAKSFNDIALDFTWIAYGITIGLIAFVISGIGTDLKTNFPNYMQVRGDFRFSNHYTGFYLILYGIPTFITGGIMKFKPMIIGGIVCWILALVSIYTNYKEDMLLTAIAATAAWLIPGIILNNLYRKSKKAHV